MPKYVIEREIPGAGNMSAADLSGASAKSCNVLNKLGNDIQWIHSYVTGDKIYCIYTAPSEDLIRQHAELSGFPANKVSEVKALIDPTRAALNAFQPAFSPVPLIVGGKYNSARTQQKSRQAH